MATATRRSVTVRGADSARLSVPNSGGAERSERPPAPEAELLAVIGPAGPGRSALLEALGERRWARARAAGPSPREPRVPEMPQESRVPETPQASHVSCGSRESHVSHASYANRRVAAVRLREPLGSEPAARADQLLLALGLTLADEPDAVLVDSADEGLDTPARDRVWSRLRRIAESGVTVVAACESAETAGTHAHRTVLMPYGDG
ncbi:ABC transporter ATP-binding protein [Streptomyces pathocidini]|uniref:ATP-binding cassette domain-containing protein n=1 Tax=Streptomyces pathocidini TaxID=1650571 RepID=UPI00340464A3